MLHKDNRLKKVRDFNLIMTHGRWVTGTGLRLKVLRLKSVPELFPKRADPAEFGVQLRFAVSVGTKIAKQAVKRNRLRRQLTEIIRLWLKDECVALGWYGLVVVDKSALTTSFEDLKNSLETVFKRAGLFG